MLIILTLTGVIISYQWAGNLVYTLTGNEVPQQQQQRPPNASNGQEEQPFALPENLNDILTKAENHTAWKTISLRFPITKDSAIFTIDEGIYLNRFGRSTLTIDTKTRRSFQMGTLRRTKYRPPASFVVALYAHGRIIRFHRSIDRFYRLHRRRGFGLDGNFACIKTFSKLAKYKFSLRKLTKIPNRFFELNSE